MKEKHYQVLIEMNESKFKQMPKKRLLAGENIEQMHKNLWSMFEMKYSIEEMREFKRLKQEPFGMSVSNYGWTARVKDAFYGHPFHLKLVNAMKKNKGMLWAMWTLNHEPCDAERIKEFKKRL